MAITKLQRVITFDGEVRQKVKVARNGGGSLHVLCDDLSVVWSLWILHLVNIRINKLQMAIKKLQRVINFEEEVGQKAKVARNGGGDLHVLCANLST